MPEQGPKLVSFYGLGHKYWEDQLVLRGNTQRAAKLT